MGGSGSSVFSPPAQPEEWDSWGEKETSSFPAFLGEQCPPTSPAGKLWAPMFISFSDTVRPLGVSKGPGPGTAGAGGSSAPTPCPPPTSGPSGWPTTRTSSSVGFPRALERSLRPLSSWDPLSPGCPVFTAPPPPQRLLRRLCSGPCLLLLSLGLGLVLLAVVCVIGSQSGCPGGVRGGSGEGAPAPVTGAPAPPPPPRLPAAGRAAGPERHVQQLHGEHGGRGQGPEQPG